MNSELNDKLIIDGGEYASRLLLGTALYPSPKIMQAAVIASGTSIATVSLRRQSRNIEAGGPFWDLLKATGCNVLPNTAGCHSAKEAITTAQMARELFGTRWIKLEVIGDEYNLQPDPFALIEASKELISQGFLVFPYCTDDLVLCERLVALGCEILMPWASPIGTGKGLLNPYALSVLRERFPSTTLIVDAGIGKPSHAAAAMEMGYDAVLLNTAVASAINPVVMASAFKDAVSAGRKAYQSGLIETRELAKPSTPEIGKPFWHQQS